MKESQPRFQPKENPFLAIAREFKKRRLEIMGKLDDAVVGYKDADLQAKEEIFSKYISGEWLNKIGLQKKDGNERKRVKPTKIRAIARNLVNCFDTICPEQLKKWFEERENFYIAGGGSFGERMVMGAKWVNNILKKSTQAVKAEQIGEGP